MRFCVIDNDRVVFKSDSMAAAGAYRDVCCPESEVWEVVPEVAPIDVAESIERIRLNCGTPQKHRGNEVATDTR